MSPFARGGPTLMPPFFFRGFLPEGWQAQTFGTPPPTHPILKQSKTKPILSLPPFLTTGTCYLIYTSVGQLNMVG